MRHTDTAVTYHGEPVVGDSGAGGGGGRARDGAGEPLTEVAEGRYFAADAVVGELPFVAVAKVDGMALVLRSFEVSVAVEVVCFIRMYVFHGRAARGASPRCARGLAHEAVQDKFMHAAPLILPDGRICLWCRLRLLPNGKGYKDGIEK